MLSWMRERDRTKGRLVLSSGGRFNGSVHVEMGSNDIGKGQGQSCN